MLQPIFRLEKLHLCGNNINALSLSDILNHNTTLQVLTLNYTAFERNTAWGGLFTRLLLSPNCTLECLQLGSTNLDDFNLQLLANVLAHNGSLKRLGLCSNPAVTPATWMAFATYLQSPSSALEELDLSNNSINDDALLLFVDALADNNMLRKFDFSHNTAVTDAGWMALRHLLCNRSSIIDTYHSNHTLEEVGYYDDIAQQLGVLGDGVKTSLRDQQKLHCQPSGTVQDHHDEFQWKCRQPAAFPCNVSKHPPFCHGVDGQG